MPQLSVIVPTFNELGNVVELRNRVAEALTGIDWEMIFVDDNSPDGTAQAVREMAQADRRVRCIQRIGRRGLSTACIEGMLASSAPVVAVIDADLQHDERLLPKMFELIQGGDLDVVVGSRYVESGGIGNWDSSRAAFSRWATQLSRVVLKADLKDPMSGFFMIRHEAALACIKAGMSGVGFKILLDLFATSPTPLRHRELPYEFRNRVAGESKLDTNVAWEYFIMLLDKFTGGVVPIRFIAFSLVGGLGLVVNVQGPGHVFSVGPEWRHAGGHDQQLRDEQRADLPRHASARLELRAGLAVVRGGLQRRGAGQRRHRRLPVPQGQLLDHLGDCRRAGGGGVELRRDRGLHLENAQGRLRIPASARRATANPAACAARTLARCAWRYRSRCHGFPFRRPDPQSCRSRWR